MGGKPPDQFDIGKPRYHEDLAGNFLHAALMGLALGVTLLSPAAQKACAGATRWRSQVASCCSRSC